VFFQGPGLNKRIVVFKVFTVFWALLFFPVFLRAEQPPYQIQIGEQRYPLASVSLKGNEYVSLKDLAQALGAQIEAGKEAGRTTLVYKGNRIFLSPGSLAIFVNRDLIGLPAPVEDIRGELYVPPEFVTKGVSRIYESNISWGKRDKVFLVSSSSAASVSLEYRSLRNMTRLVFKFDREVHCTFLQPPGRILLRIQSGAVFAFFDEVAVGDGAVENVAFKGGQERGTIIINLGGEFKEFKESVADNPYRIIIDCYRKNPYEPPAHVAEETAGLPQPGAVEPETAGGLPAAGAPGPGELEEPIIPLPATSRPLAEFKTVVIDPGHGGEEYGAIGPDGLSEKEVTLAVARLLKSLIEQKLGLRVILTRETDMSLSLDERTAIANNHKASLFVSIHANASRQKTAWGAETYFLSTDASDDSSRKLAALENNPLGLPGESEGMTSDIKLILWDMAQTQYLEESKYLASLIQNELNRSLDIRDRGIKQAPFKVLMGAMMPAVLVEVGFISNPSEENKLKDKDYQTKISVALYKSILRFKNVYEARRNNGK
jgi:N-acetylmuramoyl-L-alanine amidase